MRIYQIIKGTSADGPGLRNSIYVSGCAHACPGCHNPQTWSFSSGAEMTIQEILDEVLDDYADITISGGDPVYQAGQVEDLCRELKRYNKNIWLYTGFTYEEVRQKCPSLLLYIDVLVDGLYDANKRDLTRFCGSTNQRIIYLKNGEIETVK